MSSSTIHGFDITETYLAASISDPLADDQPRAQLGTIIEVPATETVGSKDSGSREYILVHNDSASVVWATGNVISRKLGATTYIGQLCPAGTTSQRVESSPFCINTSRPQALGTQTTSAVSMVLIMLGGTRVLSNTTHCMLVPQKWCCNGMLTKQMLMSSGSLLSAAANNADSSVNDISSTKSPQWESFCKAVAKFA